ncbi:rifamycin-inactivating phosphotransferase [Pseudonocardia sp. HH130630-07]|uniref:rifamycin-inactivating phosphotransferase n=1 Tax=Pseudonocardia sp. HH130630-07 TaxID=1690815 RepID=UPI000A52ACD1|nr:rifamycin-inactivating phosphotransferase [Pseudonocardia sp. HH130630-07]
MPVLNLQDVDRSRFAEVGGKAVNLGELSRIPGVDVPPGVCVPTGVFRRAVAGAPELADRIARLGTDGGSAAVRELVAGLAVPDDVVDALARALDRDATYAVRSSATAEDLPEASFAGQQDTYLHVRASEVVAHVRACWASLFTDRAVAYRSSHGVDHRSVQMAVVVQRMVAADASGVLFTADPLTSDRRVCVVEAVPGLGEALVSGRAAADRFTVRDGVVVDRAVAVKTSAVRPAAGGGTRVRPVAPEEQRRPVLTTAQVVRLAELGRSIEARAGCPQDVEWCLSGDAFRIVQSRPVTTLFPVPRSPDGRTRVHLSVGHQQMMTDAMTPLGLSVWQLTTPRPMTEIGGRLYVDVTRILASPAARDPFLQGWDRTDPLVGDALRTVGDRVGPGPAEEGTGPPAVAPREPIDADPGLVAELVADNRASVAAAARDLEGRRGTDVFDAVTADVAELRRLLLDPRSHQVFTTAMDAAHWLDEHLHAWLGVPDAAGTLTLSAPGNVTSEMGLALLDVADAIRPHADAVAVLRAGGDDVLDRLPAVPAAVLRSFLEVYGMRCVGEIDLGRPRWGEDPAALLPVLLGHIDHAEPGAGRRRFAHGAQQASATAKDLLERLRALPGGERKARETATMIDRLRTFIGYREYPKYGLVSRYLLYRRAIMAEAGRLVADGVLADRGDAVLLRFDELREVVRTGRADARLLRERRAELDRNRTLTPPRVVTSDGETANGTYRRTDLPDGALAGLAVSGGVVEGRARVLRDLSGADLGPGDVLVTAFTDPSWSPAFVAVAGLVTEVGGLMTHGAVVAREYGLPAVVGVPGATRLIADGQRIRVDGTGGYVELLDG